MGMDVQNSEFEVMGVYSYSSEHEYRLGVRNSRFRHGTYWYVRKVDEETYDARPINGYHLPTGAPKPVPTEKFLKYYTPELDYYQQHTVPCLETLRKKLRLGRRYFNLGLLDRAENEFAKAVLMQEDSVPGNMGLCDVYAEQHEFTKLREILDKLLNIDEIFREEQRHRFNAFGINLRKKGLFDDAVRFYTKALEVNEKDENLHFNIARAYHSLEMGKKCRKHLERALELEPDMREAKCLIKIIRTEAGTVETIREKIRAAKEAERNGLAGKRYTKAPDTGLDLPPKIYRFDI